MAGSFTKLCYKFTAESVLKEFLKAVDVWRSYR